MSSLQKEPKIYGAVESQSYITFTGFCKRIYDTTQQSVDVFIDDVKIDTIQANQKIADIENKYEVFDTNGFCFTYELPKEYIGQKHKLEFKTQDGEQLLHSPTHTLDKFSPLYNQAMFIESLKEPLKYNAIDNGYTKNALSFIAIEENLSDEGFIEFILEMCKKHKQLTLSIFYFNEHQKNQANKVLSQVKNKSFFNPSSVEELIKNSEIYLHNVVEEFRFTINEEYYNKVKNVQAIKENLFMIELTRKAKKKKDMAEMTVHYSVPISFKISIMAEIFKDHERCNEFMFENSLNQPIDEEKIKDIYCPNSIGFLATKENLEDDEFVGYIKELMVRFPNVQFKGFCFNSKEKIVFQNIFNSKVELIIPCSVYDSFKEIEIIITTEQNVVKYNKFLELIYKYSNQIIVVNFIESNINKTVREFQHKEHILFSVFKDILFSNEEIIKSEYNWIRLVYTKVNALSYKDEEIDNNALVYDLVYLKRIEAILNSSEIKSFFIKLQKIHIYK